MATHVVHLIYSEGFDVAELAELSQGAQQLGLNFWIHVGQQVAHISHSGHGELWEGQLQQTGHMDTRGNRF